MGNHRPCFPGPTGATPSPPSEERAGERRSFRFVYPVQESKSLNGFLTFPLLLSLGLVWFGGIVDELGQIHFGFLQIRQVEVHHMPRSVGVLDDILE